MGKTTLSVGTLIIAILLAFLSNGTGLEIWILVMALLFTAGIWIREGLQLIGDFIFHLTHGG